MAATLAASAGCSAHPGTLVQGLARPLGQRVKPAWQTVTKVTRLPVRLFENKYINYLKKPIKSSFESFMQGEPR